jgi:hypothetical protein
MGCLSRSGERAQSSLVVYLCLRSMRGSLACDAQLDRELVLKMIGDDGKLRAGYESMERTAQAMQDPSVSAKRSFPLFGFLL